MELLDCDVVVVGAGPAGSLAARSAAEQGVEVLILEEHPEVGLPVYCAEALSLQGIEECGVDPKPPFVCQEITKARVFAPDMNYVDLVSSEWKGFTLNRDMFDRSMSNNAVEAGAKLMTSTTVTGVIREGKSVVGVFASNESGSLEVKAKVVIGADGHSSIIRRTAGFRRWFPDVGICAQFRLGGLNLDYPEINEFYVGSNIAPGGYAWVFPKSSDVANVGLGVRRIHKAPPIVHLRKWVSSDPRFRDAEVLLTNGGICPASGQLDRIVDDGVMLTGDAAGQLIPVTGAGVHSGAASGKIAGEVAAKAAEEGDVSSKRLSEYVERFDKSWGKRIRDSRKMVEMLDKFSDDDLNALARIVTSEDILNLANGTAVSRTLAKLVTKAPGDIIRLMSAYILG
ncbi:MAG: NAD(P)/FAD-dependent oxidoreductase [Candidatus Bathyarchaeota archaeon]|nr:MAG: NAD(P)/FAD-dependent oxidoreductase [Candidatus Bathyarchaeota archaeon]